jgi:uncharacterized protein YdeI (BOF family)
MKKIILLSLLSLLGVNLFGQVTLSGTNYTETFDGVASGLPTGWTVRTGATASNLGTSVALTTAANAWNNTTGAFKNSASAEGLTSSSTSTAQSGSTDRVIGVRQTGSFGDAGAGFVLQITNTTGFENLQLSLKLQSLDIASARTVTWVVDWATGATPTSFTPLTTSPVVNTTGGSTFSNTTITATLPASVNNQSNNLWIRVVALTVSTGSGSRPTTGIDDFSLSYSAVSTSAPNIITSVSSLTGFTTSEGTPSTEQSYTVEGSNLTDNITITAPTGYEISQTASSGYANTLTLTQSSGSVPTTTIYARLTGTTSGVFNGNISHSSTGATTKNIAVSGNVCGITATNIATVRATIPIQATYSGSSVTIQGNIIAIFGTSKFYVQDATGGIAVFFSNVVTTNSLVLGDLVRMTGTTVRFNGEAQINTLTCITKLSSGTVPAPAVFDSNNPPSGVSLNTFLTNNEGGFIKIISTNILGAGNFASNTNYSIANCNSQGNTEIRIDATATSLIGATIPSVTQDITGVLGRFVNAAATTNKLQMFPRNISDITNSMVACTITGGCGITTFADDPTKLDIMNWNIEWLGHPTNGPSASGVNDAVQIANAQSVLNGSGADIFMLAEICQYNAANPSDNTTAFGKLIEGLNTTFGANTYSGECSAAVSKFTNPGDPTPCTNVDANPQRVCIIYKNSVVTKIFSKPMFENFTPATYPPTGTPCQFWASGRKPFMFMGEINLGGQKDTILFVGLHAKAGSALEDYQRRQFDTKAMYDTLQAQYPNRRTMILGDMNDDMDVSIYNSSISSYAPFLYADPNETNVNGTRPNANWNAVSKTLSDAGCASTASFADGVDHQIISNEFISDGFRYLNGTVSSFRPPIANYANTTSDHYIVTSRFQYSTCPISLNLVSPADDYASGMQTKQASSGTGGKITATNMITGSANATYQAKAVELNAGFKAESGTVFKAEVGGCN